MYNNYMIQLLKIAFSLSVVQQKDAQYQVGHNKLRFATIFRGIFHDDMVVTSIEATGVILKNNLTISAKKIVYKLFH